MSTQLVSLFFAGIEAIKMLRVLRVFRSALRHSMTLYAKLYTLCDSVPFLALSAPRLVKTSLRVRMLLSTVLSSSMVIAEIVVLDMVILLSFSFIGMQTFDGNKYGHVINSYRNFDTFPTAFYTCKCLEYKHSMFVVCYRPCILHQTCAYSLFPIIVAKMR